MKNFVIKVYNTLPQEALDLRIKVFVDEQGFVDEVDEFDSVATHLVMYDGEKPIATCRFYLKEDKETYMFGRLCVLKEYRGKSLGREMLKSTEEIVKEKGESDFFFILQRKDNLCFFLFEYPFTKK